MAIQTLIGILNIVCAVINVFLGIVVLLRSYKLEKINIIMIIFTIVVGLWCFVTGMAVINYLSKPAYTLWIRLTWIMSFTVPTAILMICTIFDRQIRALYVILMYLVASFLSIVAFTPLGVKDVINVFPLQVVHGPLNLVFRMWFLIFIGLCIYIIVKDYKKLEGLKKLQFHYFLMGIFAFACTGIFFGAILPLFGEIRFVIAMPPLSLLYMIPFVYAITKKDLLDLDIVICDISKSLLTWLILVTLTVGFFYIFTFLLNISHLISTTMAITLTFGLCLLLPVKEKIGSALESVILKKRTEYQEVLNNCSKAVVSILDIDELSGYVINSLRSAIGVEKVGVFLEEKYDNETVFKLHASYGIDKSKTDYFPNEKILNWLRTKKETFIVDVTLNLFPHKVYEELVKELSSIGAILVIPLICKNELVGLVTLDKKRVDGNIFDYDDITLLENLANQLAIAIENAKLYGQLEDMYTNITRAMSLVLEAKDDYYIGHSDNVTKYSLAIAKKLNMSHKDMILLTQASMLHDLGKIGVHDYILTKVEKLTDNEWDEIKTHTLKGEKILKPLGFMKEVSEIIRNHHERWDGTGYPNGLKGDSIPLSARILSVADAFDAMVSERPYRTSHTQKRYTVEEATRELKNNRGSQFNPEIVDTFIEVLNEIPSIVSTSVKMRNSTQE
ncbi:MAG: hypothetical protein AUJ85_04545 [Elusimicrobia bacterium CG1_02_37_114]|nr:MAG: hypothetical protein AUJ85_04545 [Elusimicrobia bacterium CG1_02_37_114]PIV52681.1 MAG: hypothetical protein COS17_07865 [Elusimicrobia bacterium CG02_land_8_20_14_3_00_37_13]PIZ14150.1 MAG: hypothetical protein COY53_01090 [Elusimicrobia bacterium CG_4_10_14_0_8_um_filter_37_32]